MRYIGGHFVKLGGELKRPHCRYFITDSLLVTKPLFKSRIIRSFRTDLERCHLVLKSCFYTYDPGAVLEVFPDACLIFTRRNLRDALGSMMLLFKMVCNVRVYYIYQRWWDTYDITCDVISHWFRHCFAIDGPRFWIYRQTSSVRHTKPQN